MASWADFLKNISRASITNDRELTRYVICISVTCLTIALTVDVINQMAFFVDWQTSLRSWTITALVVLVLTIPISHINGKAHLELYRAKLRVDELSRTDPLTGLPNRRGFMEAVEARMSETMVLVIIDIDRFKSVNDTHGHVAGDKVIRSVGKILAAELGVLGSIFRVGGEEFALLAAGGYTDDLVARLLAFRDRVRSTPIIVGGSALTVTISAGVAGRSNGEPFARLYSDADRALYKAKSSGRNRIGFSPALVALDRVPRSEAALRADRGLR